MPGYPMPMRKMPKRGMMEMEKPKAGKKPKTTKKRKPPKRRK